MLHSLFVQGFSLGQPYHFGVCHSCQSPLWDSRLYVRRMERQIRFEIWVFRRISGYERKEAPNPVAASQAKIFSNVTLIILLKSYQTAI